MNKQRAARSQKNRGERDEQWYAYWQRKQHLRRKRQRSYVALLFFTALFGFVSISLRLDLRKPPEERFYQNLGSSWNFWRLWGPQTRHKVSPDSEDLEPLIGKALTDTELQTWGEPKHLIGSNDELDILYFAKTKIYLIRKKSNNIVVYASKKKP